MPRVNLTAKDKKEAAEERYRAAARRLLEIKMAQRGIRYISSLAKACGVEYEYLLRRFKNPLMFSTKDLMVLDGELRFTTEEKAALLGGSQ